jgi:two-component system NtrC family response regulator
VGDGRTILGTMITAAPEMMKVARTIERVANTGVSVMLLGASGTGKELIAQGLHQASNRRGGAFVAINCAAIPENLLEAELFGYEKGAFTGASEPPRARSSWPRAAPCSSTRLATCRCRCRSNCCASSRSG